MRTRHANNNTMSMKERTSGGVVELMVVIALNDFDGGSKLSGKIRKKIRKTGKSVRFKT
jgi:hypothetical protein